MYYIKLENGKLIENLTFEQAEEMKKDVFWEYIGTMESLHISEKLKKLNKGERLK